MKVRIPKQNSQAEMMKQLQEFQANSARMEEELNESTYHYLDSIINSSKTGWSKRDDEYNYSVMWGNGLPAPKGESEEDDGMFSLSFKRGSKIINLSHGSW